MEGRSARPVSPAAVTPYPSYPFLRLGSKGDFVAWAQQLLAGAGYPVPITGYYQGSTQAAVYSFQAGHGLPQTGNLDVPDLADPAPERSAAGPLDQGRRRGVRLGWPRGAAAAPLGEAAGGAG